MFDSDRRGKWIAWRRAGYAIAAVSGVTFGFVQPARAQQTASTSASAEQAASNSASGDLETVTVTARRVEERLVDVPVAAIVLEGPTIEKYAIADLTQLNVISPGLDITKEPGGFPGAAISIRGIENFGTGDAGLEQPVAVIVDGMPISRGYIVDAGFFDLANIQTLKGPQALFFGKDSPAGVLALNSVTPKPGEPVKGYAKASYGFLQEDPIIEGAVSFPVTDTLAMRVAVRGEDMQGGYVNNGAVPLTANISGYPVSGANFRKFPATKELVGRFTAVWTPTDALDATFKYLGSYYHDNSANGSTVLTHCDNGVHPYYHNLLTGSFTEDTPETCGNNRTTYDPTLPSVILAGFPRAPADGKYYTRVRQDVGTLTVNYRLPQVSISSITGIYHVNAGEFDDFDMDTFAETPVLQEESTVEWNEELRARTSFHFPVNFTFGGFFEHENRSYYQEARIFTLGPYPVPGPFYGITADYINDDHNYSDNYSFFGQANWHIADNLELAAGGRWTSAHKRSDIGQPFQYADLFYPNPALDDPSFTPTGNIYHVSTRYKNFSPEATLTWHPTPDTMIYAAYKTGFLAGGVQNSGVIPNYTQLPQSEIVANLTYAPEKNRGGEVGIKGSALDGRFSGDVTVYRYDYTDVQIATYHVATTSFTVGNAASAVNEGIDINANYKLASHWSVNGFVGYVRNRFSSYPNAPCYSGQTCPAGTQDLAGTSFGTAPVQVHFGTNYEASLTGTYRLGMTADVATYTRAPNIDRQPETGTQAYTLFNASLRLFSSDAPWELALIGTNLTDQFYASNLFGKPLGKPQDLIGVANPGREIRLQGLYRF